MKDIEIITREFGYQLVLVDDNGKVHRSGFFPNKDYAKTFANKGNDGRDKTEYMTEINCLFETAPFDKKLYTEKLVIFSGKHGDRIYIAQTFEDFGNICLQQFKHDDASGYYNWYLNEPEPKAPSFPTVDINLLPEELRDDGNKKWDEYNSHLKAWKDNQEVVRLVEACRNGDAKSARTLAYKMSKSEYQEFSIEAPINSEERLKERTS